MGFLDWLWRLLSAGVPDGDASPEASVSVHPPRFGAVELANRLGLSAAALESVPVGYRSFTIPKRSGGRRTLHEPVPQLKAVQRTILRRVLGKLHAHPAAMGFEKGRSIVDNALMHTGAKVVLKMDVKDFFPSTRGERVWLFFRRIGWDEAACDLLTRLTTREDGLPQGAPTSPRLSNLVNYELDVRLDAAAARCDAWYTRYADDLTFSVRCEQSTEALLTSMVPVVLREYGYRLNRRKTRLLRRHHSQRVTGLTVNDKVGLPRETRRRLRAIRHRLDTGRPATLSEEQMAGWDALEQMIRLRVAEG
ncbi:MAG: reverse transcriptase family protein [Phycisphaerae bacterium]